MLEVPAGPVLVAIEQAHQGINKLYGSDYRNEAREEVGEFVERATLYTRGLLSGALGGAG
jgi:hypothetical protein